MYEMYETYEMLVLRLCSLSSTSLWQRTQSDKRSLAVENRSRNPVENRKQRGRADTHAHTLSIYILSPKKAHEPKKPYDVSDSKFIQQTAMLFFKILTQVLRQYYLSSSSRSPCLTSSPLLRALGKYQIQDFWIYIISGVIEIIVHWIPGRFGIYGKERADKLAKATSARPWRSFGNRLHPSCMVVVDGVVAPQPPPPPPAVPNESKCLFSV